MGLASLIIQRVANAYAERKPREMADFLTAGLLLQSILVILLVGLSVVFAGFLPTLMNVQATNHSVLRGSFLLAAIATGINILNNGLSGFSLALQRTTFVSIATITTSLIGLAITFLFLQRGWGLWAIPIGLVIRNGSLFLLLIGNTVLQYWKTTGLRLRVSRQAIRDLMSISPAMFAGKLGGAAMRYSEAALVAIVLTPQLATVYILTRRAADIVLLLLSRFGGSVFAGFSHLVGSDRQRAGEVYQELLSVYVAAGLTLVGAYIALNRSFMALWVDSSNYAGHLVTILIGVSALASGLRSLINYLYAATGKLAHASSLLLAEAIVQLPLMAFLLRQVGLVGLPIGTLMTVLVASVATLHFTNKVLPIPMQAVRAKGRVLLLAIIILALSATAGRYQWASSWQGLVGVGIIYGILASVIVLVLDTSTRHTLLNFVGSVKFARRRSL
jgi:O-antigen/teichoic acid export membrane protein